VIIDGNQGTLFLNSPHGALTCQTCHGGMADFTFATMTEAHTGVVADPSAAGACDGCHAAIAAAAGNSLHSNLWGYRELIEHRTSAMAGDYDAPFEDSCNGCHTTCGQCHVSRPNSVGGGLVNKHNFREPHMTNQCTACHGSRIAVDYFGETGPFGTGGGLPGNLKDVHWSSRLMKCDACHTAAEMHGDGDGGNASGHYEHRYEVEAMPRCETCHAAVAAVGAYHQHHNGDAGSCHTCHLSGDNVLGCETCHTGPGGGAVTIEFPLPTLQCQVCHSQPYKNCTSCHSNGVGGGYDEDAISSEGLLKIARNPRTDTRGEYDYSIVRHVPVDPQTYQAWGLSVGFGAGDQPTWKYASPHNILKNTAQTTVESGQSCGASCHGSDFYLRAADIAGEPDEVVNQPYVIP